MWTNCFPGLQHGSKDKCILSVQWLLHACMKCCYDVSEAVVLDHFANFRDSVQPFLDKSFKDFASVRLWKFSAVKGEPEVQVKKNELNAQWTDLQGRTEKTVEIIIQGVKLDSRVYAAAHRTFSDYEQISTTDRCEEKEEYKASKNVKQMIVSLNEDYKMPCCAWNAFKCLCICCDDYG